MGAHSRRQRRRSNLTFPENRSDALSRYASKNVPTLKWRFVGRPEEVRKPDLLQHGQGPWDYYTMLSPGHDSIQEDAVHGWLVRHGIPFDTHVMYFGGRGYPGGTEIDFVLLHRAQPIALRVQSYWHKPGENLLHDDKRKQWLEDVGYWVEDLWGSEMRTPEMFHSRMLQIVYGFKHRGHVSRTGMGTRRWR